MKPLTIQEHKELGRLLKKVRTWSLNYASIRPKTKARHSRQYKIMKLIDKLKDKLDNQVFDDYPELPFEELVSIYYGDKQK